MGGSVACHRAKLRRSPTASLTGRAMYGSMLHKDESLPPLPILTEDPARPNHSGMEHGPAASSSTTKGTHLVDDGSAYQLYRDYEGHCNDNNNTSSSSEGQHYPYYSLLFILVRQLGVAIVVCKSCTDGAKRWADYQCDSQLSSRPPPYYWQQDGEVIVLRQDLSYPLSSNTISSAISLDSD